MSGYHDVDIAKHHYSSPFKILEEFYEFLDAIASKNKIMAGVELSDLYGAVLHQASLLGCSQEDLHKMYNKTKSVFENNHRPNASITNIIIDGAINYEHMDNLLCVHHHNNIRYILNYRPLECHTEERIHNTIIECVSDKPVKIVDGTKKEFILEKNEIYYSGKNISDEDYEFHIPKDGIIKLHYINYNREAHRDIRDSVKSLIERGMDPRNELQYIG